MASLGTAGAWRKGNFLAPACFLTFSPNLSSFAKRVGFSGRFAGVGEGEHLDESRNLSPILKCGFWSLFMRGELGAACKAAAVQPRLVTRGQGNAEERESSLKPQPLAGGRRAGALRNPARPKTRRDHWHSQLC